MRRKNYRQCQFREAARVHEETRLVSHDIIIHVLSIVVHSILAAGTALKMAFALHGTVPRLDSTVQAGFLKPLPRTVLLGLVCKEDAWLAFDV